MIVEPTADRMVFLVTSSHSITRKYRVDCLENAGAMRCACPDFSIRRQPALDNGELALKPRSTLCKHCEAVIFHVCRQIFAEMAKTEDEPQKTSFPE